MSYKEFKARVLAGGYTERDLRCRLILFVITLVAPFILAPWLGGDGEVIKHPYLFWGSSILLGLLFGHFIGPIVKYLKK